MASRRHNLLKAILHARKKKKKKRLRLFCLFGDQNLRCCSTQWLGPSLMGPTQHCVCLLNVPSAKCKNCKGQSSSSGRCLPCQCHAGCPIPRVDAPILTLRENFSNKMQVSWKKLGGRMENLTYLVYLFSFQLSTGLFFFCLVLGSVSLIPSVLFLFACLCCRWFHAGSIPLLSCDTDSLPEPRPRCWTPCSYSTESRCRGHHFLLR